MVVWLPNSANQCLYFVESILLKGNGTFINILSELTGVSSLTISVEIH